MKIIKDIRIMTTQLFRIENTEDLGLGEIVGYIKHVMEDIMEETVEGKWVKKFKDIEISFIKFQGEREDSRFNNDNLFVDIDKDLIQKLKDAFNTELSQYPVKFVEIQDIDKGELFIRFNRTVK